MKTSISADMKELAKEKADELVKPTAPAEELGKNDHTNDALTLTLMISQVRAHSQGSLRSD